MPSDTDMSLLWNDRASLVKGSHPESSVHKQCDSYEENEKNFLLDKPKAKHTDKVGCENSTDVKKTTENISLNTANNQKMNPVEKESKKSNPDRKVTSPDEVFVASEEERLSNSPSKISLMATWLQN